MGFRRRDRRGLAEIVGTLMLVLIVVAAVTAFSFYVATVEQQNLAQRTALHYKNLENVTVQGVVINNAGLTPNVTLDFSSTDIYTTYVSSVSIDGNPAQAWCNQTSCTPATAIPFPSFGGYTLNLSQFSVTPVTFFESTFYIQPFAPSPTAPLLISVGTARANEFQDTLFPPVSKIGIQFEDGYPILDGTGSYQPHEGTFVNATIDSWSWTVASNDSTAADPGTYTGQQAQLPLQFTVGSLSTYTISLTTTNTLGLSSTATEIYKAPG